MVFPALLEGLSPEARQRVSRVLAGLPKISFSREEKLIYEGLPALGFYLIGLGQVKVVQQARCGRNKIIKIVSQGELLGEESVLADGVYDYFAETISPVETWFLKQEKFQELVQRHPQLLRNL